MSWPVCGSTPDNEVGRFAEVPDVLDLQRRFADIAIVDVDVAALVGMHGIVLSAAVDHHELADRAIEIPAVVRNFLEVGLQLARAGIEGDDAGGVQVVAGARGRYRSPAPGLAVPQNTVSVFAS